jgi:hypothetical protein
MFLLKWISSRPRARKPGPRLRARRPLNSRLHLEALEARTMLSTLTVISPADSGAGSLRSKVAAAHAGDTIVFAPSLNGHTITLTSGEIDLTRSVTIAGPGATLLAISGNHLSRIFNVDNDSAALINVGITGLTLKAGNTEGRGGAITNNERLTVSNDVITSSWASNGGGISNATGATLTVLNSTLSGNSAPSVGGGGIINFGTLTVQNSTLVANVARINGGAINNQPGATATLLNTTIARNTSGGQGGGLSNLGTMMVFNSTIAGNTNSGGGGGGGIGGNNSNLTIQSTIVAQNSGGPDISNADQAIRANFSLIGDPTGLTFLPGSSNNLLNVNPLLGPLQDNGGPTWTMKPLPGSPVLNKGSNPKNLTTDQRGFPRSAAGQVDIGAVQADQPVSGHRGQRA